LSGQLLRVCKGAPDNYSLLSGAVAHGRKAPVSGGHTGPYGAGWFHHAILMPRIKSHNPVASSAMRIGIEPMPIEMLEACGAMRLTTKASR
jgi:hypothetical protein